MAAQRVMRRVRLAGMNFIYHFVRFELSCRSGLLRVARLLRDGYTLSGAMSTFVAGLRSADRVKD